MAGSKKKETLVYQHYQELLKQADGGRFVKVDLHVHTPASGDAQGKNKYDFKFDRKKFVKSMADAKSKAGKIVQRCKQLEIELIAVTDHNTPSNVHPEELGHTWYELVRDAARQADGESLCVLPGVEISTDDLHILVILDPQDGLPDGSGRPAQPAAYVVHRINTLLRKCGFTLDEYGDYTATGTSSLFDVLEYIEDLGVRCIAIPAHIDGGKKAMLEVYDNPSNVYPKLLNHPFLNAVEVVRHTTPEKKKIGSGKKAAPIKDYFARKRDSHRSPIAWMQNSDGHSIKKNGLGKRFTYVRMGRPSFSALKNALEDPETRVRTMNDYAPQTGKTTIIGMAFRKGRRQWGHIAFNPNLNCIVGKRATGKSAIVDLILYGVDRFHDDEKELEKTLIEQGYSVAVFFMEKTDVFCSLRTAGGAAPSWFKYDSARKSFGKLRQGPQLALPRKYHHESITARFSDKARLMEFIDWDIFRHYGGMKKCLERRDKYLEKMQANGFPKTSADLRKLQEACNTLFKKRKAIKDLPVKQIKSQGRVTGVEILLPYYGQAGGKPSFMVKVRKGKYKASNRRDYIDKAELYVLHGGRYRSFNRLSTGLKNAVMMVFLMNQGAFGPLIIDGPEQYLDVDGITQTLVPRMRLLKTVQQIICVTRDEHILLSGDAENVIVTQSEEDIEVVTGDINDRSIQQQILEVFEGDPEGRSLRDKNRKLGAILDELA
ncbi:MAG: PHP domain-containing protein [Planctomycetota bacterium]|jgi:hypothetical protein